MKSNNTLTFLGTGGSMGSPVIGCSCSVCLSTNPKNTRLRPGALLKVDGKVIVIDTGPDFRTQALREEIDRLDGVIITHAHHDHIAGLDDLRVYYMFQKKPIPCLLSTPTFEEIKLRFEYLFRTPRHQDQLTSKIVPQFFPNERGAVDFLDLEIRYFTYEQAHMPVNGIRIGDFAYVSDIKEYPESIFEDLQGVSTLVLSALREDPSPLHFNLEDAIQFSDKLGAKKVWLTHVSHDLEHEKTNQQLPPHIQLAHDGLCIEI